MLPLATKTSIKILLLLLLLLAIIVALVLGAVVSDTISYQLNQSAILLSSMMVKLMAVNQLLEAI